MVALVAIMSLYHAALGYAVARWLPRRGAIRWLVAVPAAWLLVEWWRGWFLSGFSWLSLGYSQTDTWLSRFAPITGVYGISALLLVCAGALTRDGARDEADADHCRGRVCRALDRRRRPGLGRMDASVGSAGDGGRGPGRDSAGPEVARLE